MKLTEGQIDRLFEFVKKKYVQYYDVQVELVDHLASAIGEKMAEEPGKEFEQVLNEVYGAYGITGFTEFMNRKEKALGKRVYKLWFRELAQWFQWPKILVTIASSFLIWQLCKWGNPENIAYWAMLLFMIVIAYFLYYRKKYLCFREGYSLLSLESMLGLGYMIGIIFVLIPISILPAIYMDSGENIGPSALSVTIWFEICLLLLISYTTLFRRMRSQARETYPMVFKE